MYVPVTYGLVGKTKKIESHNWHSNFPCDNTVSSDTKKTIYAKRKLKTV